jgi:hypothetical protein
MSTIGDRRSCQAGGDGQQQTKMDEKRLFIIGVAYHHQLVFSTGQMK